MMMGLVALFRVYFRRMLGLETSGFLDSIILWVLSFDSSLGFERDLSCSERLDTTDLESFYLRLESVWSLQDFILRKGLLLRDCGTEDSRFFGVSPSARQLFLCFARASGKKVLLQFTHLSSTKSL